MARTFDGTDDYLTLGIGNAFAFGPGTVAAIVKRSTDTTHDCIASCYGPTDAESWSFNIHSADHLWLWCNTSNALHLTATFTVTSADGWVLIAVTKATGTVAPIFYKYKFSDGTMTPATATGSIANGSLPTTECRIGREAATFGEYFAGDIAVVGAWNVVLTQEQIQSLAFNLQAWFAVQPRHLWVLDQADVAQPVVDLSGGGANQSARTGTTVATASVPVFSYGHGVDLIGKTTGGLVELAAAAAGTSSVTSTAPAPRVTRRLGATSTGVAVTAVAAEGPRVARRLAATATGTSSVTGQLRVLKPLAASVVGTSSVTSALSVVKRLLASVVGASTVTAFMRLTVRLAATAAGAGSVSTTTQAPRMTLRLAAAPAGSSSVTALLGSLRLLAASSAGNATVTAALGVQRRLTATVAGVGSTVAALTKLTPLQGSVAGTSAVTAGMTMTRGLRAAPAGSSSTTAAVRVYRALQATVVGTSTVTVAVRVRKRLGATAAGVATVEACLRLVLPDLIDPAAPGSVSLSGVALGAVALAGVSPGAVILEPRTPYNECS